MQHATVQSYVHTNMTVIDTAVCAQHATVPSLAHVRNWCCSLLLLSALNTSWTADPIIDALDNEGAELPDRLAYEKDYKVHPPHIRCVCTCRAIFSHQVAYFILISACELGITLMMTYELWT